jgi:hypothetical protein
VSEIEIGIEIVFGTEIVSVKGGGNRAVGWNANENGSANGRDAVKKIVCVAALVHDWNGNGSENGNGNGNESGIGKKSARVDPTIDLDEARTFGFAIHPKSESHV